MELIDKERQHILQAINWLDKAIYALDKYDYNAANIAIVVSRGHMDEAESMRDSHGRE